MNFSKLPLYLRISQTLSSFGDRVFGPSSLPSDQTRKPWYFDRRLDKYIFVAFSWLVWAGFIEDFGFDAVSESMLWAHDWAQNIGPKIWPTTVLVLFVVFWTPLKNTWDVFWYDEYPGIPFFEGMLTDFVTEYLWQPLMDIDLIAATDCEDLVAFAYDIFEFYEQDRALLLDTITSFITSPQMLMSFAVLKLISTNFFKKK